MLKKILLLAVFCTGGMISLSAQDNWGIRGGLNMSTLDMTEAVFVGGNKRCKDNGIGSVILFSASGVGKS